MGLKLLLTVTLMALSAAPVVARNWTNTAGKTVTADFVAIKGASGSEVVVLKAASGQTYEVPLAQLCSADQDFAKSNSAATSVAAVASPGSIGRWTFDTDHEPDAFLQNAPVVNGMVKLDGFYIRSGKEPGSCLSVRCAKLDYEHFTVAIRLVPEREGDYLLVGGEGYRWLAIRLTALNELEASINNGRGRWKMRIPKVKLGKPMTVAVSADVASHKLVVYLNGKKEESIKLDDGTKFDVAATSANESDKVWTCTNFSNGSTFKGSVDEIEVFDRALADNEVNQLKINGKP